jgi:type IV secretory pathway VirB2 component (pilin)
MSKSLGIFALLAVISVVTSAPSQNDLKDISKEVTENLTMYIVAGAVILCIIVGLLCWTAAKGNFSKNINSY